MSESTPKKATEPEADANRRDFIRKLSYTAPVLITLGFAAHSKNAYGQLPPSAPNPISGNAADEVDEDDLLLNQSKGKD